MITYESWELTPTEIFKSVSDGIEVWKHEQGEPEEIYMYEHRATARAAVKKMAEYISKQTCEETISGMYSQITRLYLPKEWWKSVLRKIMTW